MILVNPNACTVTVMFVLTYFLRVHINHGFVGIYRLNIHSV